MSEAVPAGADTEKGLWRPSGWLGFAWGFAEGTLFFIIPDILLSWAALAGAKSGVRILGTILAGSLVAGLCMYTWAASQPAQSRAVVESVPFVRPAMFAQVEKDYREYDIAGMLKGPGSGIPYKVYAVLAPPASNLFNFLLVSIPARLQRLVVCWLVATILGWIFGNWMRNNQRLTLALFAGFWIVTYAFYWSRL